MSTFVDKVAVGLHEGRFSKMLIDYCSNWRNHLSPYIFQYAVTHLAEVNHSNSLFEILTDKEFRRKKREKFGINSLRDDLQKGLTYFSHYDYNLLKYIQIMFLEKRIDNENGDFLLVQNKYCKEFLDFLQLNVPPKMRKDIITVRLK